MDDHLDKTDIATDIAAIAQRLRPQVNPVAGGDNVTALPTAGIVGKRLESLIKRAQELEKQAHVVAAALAGGGKPGENAVPAKTPDTLFGKQMAALDELGRVLDSVGRQIERAQRSLS